MINVNNYNSIDFSLHYLRQICRKKLGINKEAKTPVHTSHFASITEEKHIGHIIFGREPKLL